MYICRLLKNMYNKLVWYSQQTPLHPFPRPTFEVIKRDRSVESEAV